MNHHQFDPWTSLPPDGRLFIAGPHDPTHRVDLAAPLAPESFATIAVFIAGGVSGGADGGVCEIFDPRSPGDGWVTGLPMKHMRSCHPSFILLAHGSILGGADPQSGGAPTPHERFFTDSFDQPRPVTPTHPGQEPGSRQPRWLANVVACPARSISST